MVQWFSLLIKKNEYQGQWFEPCVPCFLFISLSFFSILFKYLTLSFSFAFLLMIPLLLVLFGSCVRVGQLCLVRQGPVMPAAGGCPTNLDNGRARASVFVVGADGGCLDFFLSPIISLFFLPLSWRDGLGILRPFQQNFIYIRMLSG